MQPAPPTGLDVVLLTAIEIEYRAVLRAFGLDAAAREVVNDRVYVRGQLKRSAGGHYEIAVAVCPNMGNLEAHSLARDAHDAWKPALMLFVGIAATLPGEELGSVLIPTEVTYESGAKDYKDDQRAEVQPAQKGIEFDRLMIQEVLTGPDWMPRLPAEVLRPDQRPDPPTRKTCVSRSVERVIANVETRQEIAAANRKLKLIEMEGFGFASACRDLRARDEHRNLRFLMIRGICDYAGPEKDDLWHGYAAAAAADYARHLLTHLIVPPRASAPRSVLSTAPAVLATPARLVEVSDDWQVITAEFLAGVAASAHVDDRTQIGAEVLRFFDGQLPSWTHALASKYIPRREPVETLRTQLVQWQRERYAVALLTGPGGEGKSTILRQIVCELVQPGSPWSVLWRKRAAGSLPTELPRLDGGRRWLVVADDAEHLVEPLYEHIRASRDQPGPGALYLLAARDTDLAFAQADNLGWDALCPFQSEPLRTIMPDDGRAIAAAWSAFGADGLKGLAGQSVAAIAAAICDAAQNRPGRSGGDGSFFGAMLRLRYGQGLRDYVRAILDRLGKQPINLNRCPVMGVPNLRTAFLYLAIPHAANILSLHKEPLAAALCGAHWDKQPRQVTDAVTSEILDRLGLEAALDGGEIVLTRHRAIAEAAVEVAFGAAAAAELAGILAAEPAGLRAAPQPGKAPRSTTASPASPDGLQRMRAIFRRLIGGSARAKRQRVREGRDRDRLPDLNTWRTFADKCYEAGRTDLAVHLAEAAREADPENQFFASKLVQLYRKEKRLQDALAVCVAADKITPDRAWFREWASLARDLDEPALTVWLAGVSLSDQVPPDTFLAQDLDFSFQLLAIAFDKLATGSAAKAYRTACVAAAKLCLDHRDRSSDRGMALRLESLLKGQPKPSLNEALSAIAQSVLRAAASHGAAPSAVVPAARALTYERLQARLRRPAGDNARPRAEERR